MSKLKRGLTKDFEKEQEDQALAKEELFQPVVQIYQDYQYLSDEQIDIIAKILQVIDFFKENCPDTQTLMEFTKLCCQNLIYEFIPKDSPVFHIDDVGDKFYIVLSGRAGIYIRRQPASIEADEAAAQPRILKMLEKMHLESISQLQGEELMKFYGQVIKKQAKPQKVIDSELILFRSQNFDKYFTNQGICKFMLVAQKQSGTIFGEMALTNDKPRTASIFGLTDLKLLSLSKANFKQVGEKGMKALQQKIDYFLKMFPHMTKHKMSKLILYFTSAKFPANFFIWKQGDETDGFLLLKDGEMQLLQNVEFPKPPSQNNVDFTLMSLFQSSKQEIKDIKETIILTNLTGGCFVGETEVVQKKEKRDYSVKTLTICNCYCLSLEVKYYNYYFENYHIVRKTFPEFFQALNSLQQRNSQLFRRRIEDIVKTKSCNFYLTKKEEALAVERRYANEFGKDEAKPFLSSPILRSTFQSKLSKQQMVEQNKSIIDQHTKLDEQFGEKQEEFNMLKLAGDNFQKCLLIRVEKQFEQFQPAKPKAKTPYFSKQNSTVKDILQSVRLKQFPSFATNRDQFSIRQSNEEDSQQLPQIKVAKQHIRVVNPNISSKVDIIKSNYQSFMKSKSMSSRLDRLSENQMQGFMLTDSINTYHPLHSFQNKDDQTKHKKRVKTQSKVEYDYQKSIL
ncbi:unnamed protein product [Paramecium primaurelia]|uniref:Cyclic nucleotide-binding domain-containing protein n=1 Tax=Paramecium primaurelia TaxID=5886 RepID=A0A8S1PJE7_PARPR|nr:unnamed protein product [Paramecium primaurelia]